jgi:hypothetical protein
MVRFWMIAVTLVSTVKSRTVPPPLTVIGPAPAPSMVMACAVLVNASVDAKVMVVVLGNAVEEKVISALLVSVLA